jgi:REP element-mobilizing transposase RayT
MQYPLAWYLTWTTYGTWLHGDPRGSHSELGYIPPDPKLHESQRALLVQSIVVLSDEQRSVIEEVLVKECEAQGWELHAKNARTNHVHALLTAARDGKFLRARLKALTSDALSDHSKLPMAGKNGRYKWWTEKGNVVEVETEDDIAQLIVYIRDLQ